VTPVNVVRRNAANTGFDLLTGVTDVAAGANHACAIVGRPGTPYCWGQDNFGQLGDNAALSRAYASPVLVANNGAPPVPLTDAVELAPGSQHSCARRVDGTVVCWGRNDLGQLGTGAVTATRIATVPVFGVNGAVEISSLYHHTCARAGSPAQVYCWGFNSSG